MRELLLFFWFLVPAVAFAQPPQPQTPTPISPPSTATKVPPTAKVSVGRVATVTIENPPDKLKWVVYPADGLIVRREYSEDPKVAKLLLEVITDTDGKAKKSEYALIFGNTSSAICLVAVDGAAPAPSPIVPPNTPPETPPVTPPVTPPLQPPQPAPTPIIDPALVQKIVELQKLAAALQMRMSSKVTAPTQAQIDEVTAKIATINKLAEDGFTTKAFAATSEALTMLVSFWGPGTDPPPIDDKSIEKQLIEIQLTLKLMQAQMTTMVNAQKAMQVQLNSQDQRLTALEKMPTPPVTGKVAVSLTFVVLVPTPKTAAVTEDAEFRIWLKANGIGVYGVTSKAVLDAIPKFQAVAPPAIVLQDANANVIGWTPITDVAAAKAYVAQFLGK